jgi:DNA-binding CsgD family transcriptional regulator
LAIKACKTFAPTSGLETFPECEDERVEKVVTNIKLTHMITPKEKEILQLIASGLSSKQIAERLSISFYTVQTHRKNMLAKMRVKNTPELIVKMLGQAA